VNGNACQSICEARRAAGGDVVRDDPVDRLEVLRQGLARIVDDSGGGEYTITEQWYNVDDDQWQDASAPVGLVEEDAGDCRVGADSGQLVPFWEVRSIGGTVRRFVWPGLPYTAIVIGATALNNDPTTQWRYSVKRCRKTTAGYGVAKWTTEGDAFDAYNDAENPNDQIGRQGNGVSLDNLDVDDDGTDDFGFQPIPNGVIVRCRDEPIETPSGEIHYETWFTAVPNGVDGSCP
jgi:hypothetical protein